MGAQAKEAGAPPAAAIVAMEDVFVGAIVPAADDADLVGVAAIHNSGQKVILCVSDSFVFRTKDYLLNISFLFFSTLISRTTFPSNYKASFHADSFCRALGALSIHGMHVNMVWMNTYTGVLVSWFSC